MPKCRTTVQTVEAIIFYLDVIGLTDQYITNPGGTVERLWQWQSMSRDGFQFSGPDVAVKTLADNVWARIPLEHDQPTAALAVDFAIHVMQAAHRTGFDNYFGVLTQGAHVYDLQHRTLTSTGDPTDIRTQHIDTISEPHMRAAIAEKWSATLAREGHLPVVPPTVWVGSEVIPRRDLDDYLRFRRPGPGVRLAGDSFDLKCLPLGTKEWPFPQSVFQAITLLSP